MNKKLALKISKHPLIKKLMEDRTIPKSIIARLIVEEITEQQKGGPLNGEESDQIRDKMEAIAKTQKPQEANEFKQALIRLIKTRKLTDEQKQWLSGYVSELNKIIKPSKQPSLPKTKPDLFKKLDGIINNSKDETLKEKYQEFLKALKSGDPSKINFESIVSKLNSRLSIGTPSERRKSIKILSQAIEDMTNQQDQEASQDSGDDEKYTKFVNTYKDEMETFDGTEKRALFLFTVELKKNLPKNINEDAFTTLTQGFVNLVPQEQDALLKQSIEALDDETKKTLVGIVKDVDKKLAALKIIRDALKLETPQPQTEPEVEKEPSGDQETTPDEAGENEDPEKFDVASEDLQSLISVSEEFIEQFYEKALLRDQGMLVRNVLDQLVKITEKEELEKAAQRRPQPKPEEGEEQTVAEQQQNPSALRNIQVDLKSFIKLAKRSKEVLQRFDEASEKGKVIGSSLKKKFMEMLAQLQENIRDLVQDISKLNLVQEAKDTSEIEKKWDAIEKGYNDASRALSNIIAAGTEEKEAFDMENNVKDAYSALMSISHFFPSVNPFGKKTSQDMKKYSEQYEAAIKDVKSVIRDVLELSQGQGGRSTASNAIKALKEFSGQIQSIFDVKSKFDDVVVQPNEPAAEGEREDTPDTTDSSVEDIDDTKQQIDAKKAIEQFLQILVKQNFVISKKAEKQLSEGLETIALAALGGATIAKIFKDGFSRYSKYDNTVLYIFRNLLYKFLEKNNFLNPSFGTTWAIKKSFISAWKNFPKDKKEVIVKAYRKKFKEKPELTGKKVQEIVADYLTDDFKLAEPGEELESVADDEASPENKHSELSDVEQQGREALIDDILKMKAERDFPNNEEAEKEVKKAVNDQEGIKDNEKKELEAVVEKEFEDDSQNPEDNIDDIVDILNKPLDDESDEVDKELKKAKEEYENATGIEFSSDEIEILERFINFKPSVQESEEQEEDDILNPSVYSSFTYILGNDNAKKLKSKIDSFAKTLSDSEKKLIESISDKMFDSDMAEKHNKFVEFYMKRNADSSAVPELTGDDEKPETDKKQSAIQKAIQDDLEAVEKKFPNASTKQKIDFTKDKFMQRDEVEKTIEQSSEPKKKEDEIKTTVSQELIDFSKASKPKAKPFIKRLFENMDKFASSDSDKETTAMLKERNITKDSDTSNKEYLISHAGFIYSKAALDAFEEGKFKIFEGPTNAGLQVFKDLIFEEAAGALGIEVPKVLPLESIIDYSSGREKDYYNVYTDYNSITIPDDINDTLNNAVVGDDVIDFGNPTVSVYNKLPILKPFYYKDQIAPYTTARRLVGLMPSLKDGKWGVLPVKSDPRNRKGK